MTEKPRYWPGWGPLTLRCGASGGPVALPGYETPVKIKDAEGRTVYMLESEKPRDRFDHDA